MGASDELRIDEGSRQVYVGRRLVQLTRKEFDLLRVLTDHAGRTLTRTELLLKVWGEEFEGSPTTVTVHVQRIRAKIERDPRTPRLLQTVWGVGYRFEGGVTRRSTSPTG